MNEHEMRWPSNLRVGGAGRVIPPLERFNPTLVTFMLFFLCLVVVFMLVKFVIEDILIPIAPILQKMFLGFVAAAMLAALVFSLVFVTLWVLPILEAKRRERENQVQPGRPTGMLVP